MSRALDLVKDNGAWILLGLYTVLLVLVLTDFRAVMGDEAAYADPALRWHDGLGFTSIAWEQAPKQLWASNCPLYALFLAGWLTVTGLDSLWGLRAFSALLYFGGVVLWIIGCRRAGWFRSVMQETGFIGLLLGSLYATAPSQYIRPEALGVALLGFALLGQTATGARSRSLAAFAAGFVAVLVGFQFVVALAVLGCAWFVVAEEKPRVPLVLCGLGGLAGSIALFTVYYLAGVLGIFIHATFGSSGNRMAQWHGWRDPMLLAGSFLLLAGLIFRLWPAREKRWAIAALLGGPGLALVFFALSKFPQYYAPMAVIPLCTGVAAVFPVLPRTLRPVAVVFLAVAGVVGFPLSAVMNWNVMPARQHVSLHEWTRGVLRGSKAAFVDPSIYFAARGSGVQVYTQFVLNTLSAEEMAKIDTVVLSPVHSLSYLQAQSVLGRLGGDWEIVGSYPPAGHARPRFSALEFLTRLSYAPSYHFQTWRRVPFGTAGREE